MRLPLSPIDVVLLDVRLPDLSGVDPYARIRTLYPKLPVVVCTTEAEPEETDRLFRPWVQCQFRKPIIAEKLLAPVEVVVS